MTPLAALHEILSRVGANHGAAILVNDDELSQWPDAAVAAMKAQKLLAKARPASSAICPGCEQDCAMPVHTLPGTAGPPASFIICDKRSDTNRVPVPMAMLTQWQCNADIVGRFVVASLGLRPSGRQTTNSGLREIGMASGNTRSQMLCLQSNGVLTLVAGKSQVPLAEFVDYRDTAYSLDGIMVGKMVDAATTADSRYTPSDVKREARKLDTQAMYESWRKEYCKLKKNRPQMSDVWYAQQIAKKAIAHGRDVETIRKNMKK